MGTDTMTPRIPRGWGVATERGEGVWVDYVAGGWWLAPKRGPLLPEATYIRRTDPSVPADPNECLRLEDEAARLVSELPQIPVSERPASSPDAQPMVPGMMRLASGDLLPMGSFRVAPTCTNGSKVVILGDGGNWYNDRNPTEFAAAYTAAWEYTERRKAEIAEEVRQGGAPSSEPAVSPLLAELAELREHPDDARHRRLLDAARDLVNRGYDLQTVTRLQSAVEAIDQAEPDHAS